MTHGTRIDINAIKSVLTRWITEGHITPLAAFNRFWGYTFHLMQEDEITNDEYDYIIHIALDPDAQKDTALISVQRKSTYEFVCKDINIPLKEL